MHYSEVCSSILENRPKNSAEYLSIVTTILHLLIESDLELRNMLYREILRNVSNLMQTGLSPSDKSNFSSFRYFYRLSCELQIIKATDNKLNSLSVALKNLVIIPDCVCVYINIIINYSVVDSRRRKGC